MTEDYTVTQAATRVNRSRRTIERWIAAGMPTRDITTPAGVVTTRYIREEDLLRYFRRALRENPTRRRISTR